MQYQPPPQYGSQYAQYYQQQQQQQQYPGYGPYSQPIAAPFPVYPIQSLPGTPGAGRPRPIDREPSRTSTPGRPAGPGGRPLKSAMKRTRTPDRASSMGDGPHTRGRPSEAMRRQRTRSESRLRSNSLPRFVPDHLILTLRSTNELHLENIRDPTMADDLLEQIVPIWPHGLESQDNRRGKWKVEFTGNPWSCTGHEVVLTGKMVIRLYIILARWGFSYLSTVNIGNPWKAPQLIFADSAPDYEPLVFLIMFSKSGDKLTILDGPPELTEQLGTGLRATFPRKITTDRATEDGLHIFEVKRGTYGVEVDKSLLIAYVLRFMKAAGLTMCGSVPMGTRSFFHFGQRKEMWIFRNDTLGSSGRQKELGRRPSSRQSRQSRDGTMGMS